MKKIMLLLLFVTVSQAQSLTIDKTSASPILVLGPETTKLEPILVNLELKQKIEIDGHIVKFPVYFKATLDGIEIYDKEDNKYEKRNCKIDNCSIIHLAPKSNGSISGSNLIQNWQIIPNNIGL